MATGRYIALMPYDPYVADRVRRIVTAHATTEERRMFGGLAFLLNGYMACGIIRSDLVVRMDPTKHDAALTRRGARPMDFTGRPLKGYVYVSVEGMPEEVVKAWVVEALAWVAKLPPKAPSAP